MDGTITYPRNSERLFLPRQASGMPLLFKLAVSCTEVEQIQVKSFAEYAKSVDRSAGSSFVSLKQVEFACGFDNNIPYLDNAVDYAEQL